MNYISIYFSDSCPLFLYVCLTDGGDSITIYSSFTSRLHVNLLEKMCSFFFDGSSELKCDFVRSRKFGRLIGGENFGTSFASVGEVFIVVFWVR